MLLHIVLNIIVPRLSHISVCGSFKPYFFSEIQKTFTSSKMLNHKKKEQIIIVNQFDDFAHKSFANNRLLYLINLPVFQSTPVVLMFLLINLSVFLSVPDVKRFIFVLLYFSSVVQQLIFNICLYWFPLLSVGGGLIDL